MSAKQKLLEAIKIIEDYGEKLDDTVKNQEARYIFEVNEDFPNLEQKRAELLNSCTSKNLYFTKRVISDIEPTVSFICNKV